VARRRESFFTSLRTADVDYTCPLCYKRMDGLTCEMHGTFVVCRQCGAAQTADHDCLANHQPIPTPAKKRRQSLRTFNSKCCICGNTILRGNFCMNHQKYKSRVYYYQKKGVPREEVMAKVIAEARQQEKVSAMLESAQGVDISEVLV
jgi:hypothetical protein